MFSRGGRSPTFSLTPFFSPHKGAGSKTKVLILCSSHYLITYMSFSNQNFLFNQGRAQWGERKSHNYFLGVEAGILGIKPKILLVTFGN